MENFDELRWSGKDKAFLDEPTVISVGEVAVGRYGGSTEAGAHKNEDGALGWHNMSQSWTFAVLLDAHAGSDSAVAVLSLNLKKSTKLAARFSSAGRTSV